MRKIIGSIVSMIFIISYIKTCELAVCICVEDASLVRPYCINDKYSECISSVPCVKKQHGCDFLHNRKYRECQKLLNDAPECMKTGCSGEVCSDQNVITPCIYKPEYECYKSASCERQTNGKCDWTMDDSLKKCLNSNLPCKKTGCGDMCADHDIMTLWCPPSEKYKCYENATCKRQRNGECGFTKTRRLMRCLSEADN